MDVCIPGMPVAKRSCGGSVLKKNLGSCRGSITTDLLGENSEILQPHNHAPDKAQIRLAKLRNCMKDRTANTRHKPAQIHSLGVSQCDNDDVRRLLPSADICKGTLRNQRPTAVC